MKTLNRTITCFFALLAVFLALPASAQTATPNTTLCAAITSTTATSICLTSTTGVTNQTGIYVDQEYMTVNLPANQTLAASNAQVSVTRGNRAAGSGPQQHLNASIAWIALTPGSSKIPGANGFQLGTNVTDIGPCTRANQTYLPRIWVNRGIKRDCNGTGVWVDYAPGSGLDFASPTPLTTIAANGALSVSSGNYALITKAGVIALTLAAPTAGVQDGMRITIKAYNGANADTLVATSLIQTGGGSSPYTTATFGVTTAFVGATLTLEAYQGFWFVVSSSNVAFT